MRQAHGNQQARNARTARGLAVSGTAVSKKFGRYKTEEEKAVRKAGVKEDETLKQLKKAWRTHVYDINCDPYENYDGFAYIITSLQYSSEDVERFSIALAEFQDEENFSPKAGVFLSALINRSKDDNHIIHTIHLQKLIYFLGCKNRKNITVKGCVDKFAGSLRTDGTITIEGNAGDYLGHWGEGGSIIVQGNAGHSVGLYMQRGTITVEGNSDDGIGHAMSGGEIHIKGRLGSISTAVLGGKVYHKGKLIVDK